MQLPRSRGTQEAFSLALAPSGAPEAANELGGGAGSGPASLPRGRDRPGALWLLGLGVLAAFLLAGCSLLTQQSGAPRTVSQLVTINKFYYSGSGPAAAAARESQRFGAAPRAAGNTSACAAELELPQVALLFLTTEGVIHEHLWRLWLASAAGLLPAEHLRQRLCGGGGEEEGQDVQSALQACMGLAAEPAAAAEEEEGAGEGVSGDSGEEERGDPGAAAAVGTLASKALETQQLSGEPGQASLDGEGASEDGDSSQEEAAGPRRRRRALEAKPGSKGRARQQPSGRGAEQQPGAGGRGGGSDADLAEELEELYGADVIGQQHLFTVHVHPHPNFTGFPEGSLFRGREIPLADRVATAWGEHSLVDAARVLLRAAHANPRAQRFMLLSDSTVPLYSPQLWYTQLLAEAKSRVNACNESGWRREEGSRWSPRMNTYFNEPLLRQHHWRKSWQWVELTREHVDLVLRDTAIDAVFRRYCKVMWEPALRRQRICFSDEHYFPTLLAVHGRDNETDCRGVSTDIDWSRVPNWSPHPWSYEPQEVTERLFQELRRPERPGCGENGRAMEAARDAFVSVDALAPPPGSAAPSGGSSGSGSGSSDDFWRRDVCRSLPRGGYTPLGQDCPLAARKFGAETRAEVLAATAPCDSSVHVLNDGTCGISPLGGRVLHAWRFTRPVLLVFAGLLLFSLTFSASVLALLGSRPAQARSQYGSV